MIFVVAILLLVLAVIYRQNKNRLTKSTSNTQEQKLTVEFIKKCKDRVNIADLEIKNTVWGRSSHLNIYLENLELKDIPENIVPDCYIGKWVYVVGPGSNTNTNTNTNQTLAKLAKLLRAFGSMSAENWNSLVLEDFTMDVSAMRSANPKIAARAHTLELMNISPSFLEWFCDSVNLRTRPWDAKLRVTNCETKSVACLANLGVRSLAGLYLNNLPCLTSLDCPLPNIKKPNLILRGLPEAMEVSTQMANEIASIIWGDVFDMDMWLWNRICFLAGMRVDVCYELHLTVCKLDELELDESLNDEDTIQTYELWLTNNTNGNPETPPRVFVDSAIAWIYANMNNMCECHIYIDQNIDAEFENYLKTNGLKKIGKVPWPKKLEVIGKDKTVWAHSG
ncbi:hypothetical protein NEDG_02032 [Nematocida displodere]|uniref:Uncharacterized protein n=1 Tax=Nematocida displodere TaxID=1805483 RepID=A0A177ELD3_9MICR|nr:hypothetical protein NEDG_02032 [Nematocida displodere]